MRTEGSERTNSTGRTMSGRKEEGNQIWMGRKSIHRLWKVGKDRIFLKVERNRKKKKKRGRKTNENKQTNKKDSDRGRY